MSNRREARERVMQALYAQELSGDTGDHLAETVLDAALASDPDTLQFARQLFQRTLERAGELDALIRMHTENWELDRLAPVDRALLRMATCELLTFEDIPPKVTVDEAIEIAKRYSTEQSGSFLNGILDALLLDLERQGRLKKSGRGLVGIESIRDRVSQ